MNLNRCRRCKALIAWAQTARGRPIPLDVSPHPEGTVVITADGAKVLTAEQAETARMLGTRCWRPHQQSCPRAKPRTIPPATSNNRSNHR